MTDQPPKRITDHIDAYKETKNEEDFAVLFNTYLDQLTAFIKQNKPTFLNARVANSDIAQEAFAIADRKLKTPGSDITNSRQFYGLLRGIAKNIVREKVREHRADRRDVRKETGAAELSRTPTRFLGPEEMLREQEVLMFVAKVVVGEEDPQKRAIVILNLVLEHSHREIVAWLSKKFERSYSLRTIGAHLREVKELLAKRLAASGYDEYLQGDE